MAYYDVKVVSASDYHPFGMGMPNRTHSSPSYRYGFNGKEKDESGEFGNLTTYDYGFRIYNPGIGRFLSVDPLTKSYPWYTPYQFAGNKPIWAIDLDGLEELEATDKVGKEANPELSNAPVLVRVTPTPAPVRPPVAPPRVVGPAVPIVVGLIVLYELSNPQMPDCPDCGPYLTPDPGLVQRDNTEVVPAPLPKLEEVESSPEVGEPREEKITLYRGVDANHPGYKEAVGGIARPRGGSATAAEHNGNYGNKTNSIYTSWSTERWVAEDWALDTAPHGIVLKKEFNKNDPRLVKSLDASGESETLVVGTVYGADPKPITGPETKPKFDDKSGKYKDGGKY